MQLSELYSKISGQLFLSEEDQERLKKEFGCPVQELEERGDTWDANDVCDFFGRPKRYNRSAITTWLSEYKENPE